MDWFSDLPPGILENILCFLPIQEAVRTSILSREWRYRWIKIPKLEFEELKFHVSTNGAELSNGADLEQMSDQSRKRKDLIKRRKFFYAICQVLLMHEGPLHEFTLNMRPCDQSFIDDELVEIDSIIFHLSRKNTVKKLAIYNEWGWYKLPFSLFSFHQLTDLRLGGCAFSHLPTFNGFGSLTRLSLRNTCISDERLQHLLSNCPLLKNVTLGIDSCYDLISGDKDYSIISLFVCLPVVETLSISCGIIQSSKSSGHDGVPRKLPTLLIHLKYLTLNGVNFKHKDEFSFLVHSIKSSPNLEKLKIDNRNLWVNYDSMKGDICSFRLEDYADIWLEHLNELHIIGFKNQGKELNFVKLILAKSPVLKKARIYHELSLNELTQVSKILLSFPRASPAVVINV